MDANGRGWFRMAKTFEQVKGEFVFWALPFIKKAYEQDGQIDVTARREVWNNLMDDLYKDGEITEQQADEWALPDELEVQGT